MSTVALRTATRCRLPVLSRSRLSTRRRKPLLVVVSASLLEDHSNRCRGGLEGCTAYKPAEGSPHVAGAEGSRHRRLAQSRRRTLVTVDDRCRKSLCEGGRTGTLSLSRCVGGGRIFVEEIEGVSCHFSRMIGGCLKEVSWGGPVVLAGGSFFLQAKSVVEPP